jgi:drug/metabolite transporter (DMT)-like permease
MTPFRENLRGILSISAGNLLFLVNDALIKLANREMPLGEILFVRGLFATALLTPLVIVTGAHRSLASAVNQAVLWRTVAEITSAIFYILALFHIPIANANAILQVIPLVVTAGAAIFLGEAVGWRRWSAIAFGFAGVLVVIRPGLAGFDAYSVLVLVAVFLIALRDLTTRIMPRGIPALLIALITAITVCLSGPIFALFAAEHWVAPDATSAALSAGAAVFLIGGYLTAIDFMRHGDIAVVAPFRYTVILWAILAGYIVWREVPDLAMIVGSAIVIASGVYTLHRERRIARLVAESDIDR